MELKQNIVHNAEGNVKIILQDVFVDINFRNGGIIMVGLCPKCKAKAKKKKKGLTWYELCPECQMKY